MLQSQAFADDAATQVQVAPTQPLVQSVSATQIPVVEKKDISIQPVSLQQKPQPQTNSAPTVWDEAKIQTAPQQTTTPTVQTTPKPTDPQQVKPVNNETTPLQKNDSVQTLSPASAGTDSVKKFDLQQAQPSQKQNAPQIAPSQASTDNNVQKNTEAQQNQQTTTQNVNSQTDATQSSVTQEAAIEKTIVKTVKPADVDLYSDLISKFDASLNDVNINAILFSQNDGFIEEDSNGSSHIKDLKAFDDAMIKVTQTNVTSAYKSIKAIIEGSGQNDVCYMYMAYKLANAGLFTLADSAMKKVKDTDVWDDYIDSIRTLYFPKYKLGLDEELFLASANAAIIYNNLTHETIDDMMDREKLARRSDIANYLIANALFIDKDYPKALIAINRSLSINSYNLNSLYLKTQILCELSKYDEALKVANEMTDHKEMFPEDKVWIDAQMAYILSKIEKNPLKAKYYLAQYFYLNDDTARAQKELTSVVPKYKIPEASSLSGGIYFKNADFQKAEEIYSRSTKEFKRNSDAYEGLANVNLVQGNYAEAFKNYSKARRHDRKDADILVDLAVTKLLQKDLKGAKNFCESAISKQSENYKALYLMAKLRPEKAVYNLKRTTEANPFFANAWLDLADNAILNKDMKSAKEYVDCAKYLADKGCRYYYYAGLLAKINKDSDNANKNFEKAVNILSNSSFKDINYLQSKEK